MKLLHVVLIAGGAILLAVMASGIMATTTDFRTDILEEDSSVTTADVTTGTVQLTDTLWNDSTAYIASVLSDDTTDTPSATSYNSTNREVTISGLSANTTRVLTVSYNSNALEDAEAAEDIIIHLPAALIAVVILIPLLGLVSMIIWVVKRR